MARLRGEMPRKERTRNYRIFPPQPSTTVESRILIANLAVGTTVCSVSMPLPASRLHQTNSLEL